jgi:ribosome recycling factor
VRSDCGLDFSLHYLFAHLSVVDIIDNDLTHIFMSSVQLINEMEQLIADSLHHLEIDLSQLQIGRASSNLVDGVEIDSYGMKQPLKNIASISIPDASTIQIQPWDKSNLQPIEQAISHSDLNLPVRNDGNVIWISIPQPTEDRRRDLVKVCSKKNEEAKISIRNARHVCHDGLKKLKEDKSISEDEFHNSEKQMQDKVDEANRRVDELGKKKEEEIMKV